MARRMGKAGWGALGALFLWAAGAGHGAAQETVQLIAGAGPSTPVVTEFAPLLQATPAGSRFQFSVPSESIKHAGGLRSTEKYLLGRTGRPLTEEEKAQGYEEIWLAKMPIAIVVGSGAGVRHLTRDQTCGLFTGRITNWREVGGSDAEVVVFSREPGEALFQQLRKDLPCMNEVMKTRFTFRRDDQVVELLTGEAVGKTAIGFGAWENFPPEYVATVDGFASGVNLGLVYRADQREHPLIREARSLAASPGWRKLLAEKGLSAPDPQ